MVKRSDERHRFGRGGTKIAAGVISPQGKLLGEVRYPTAKVREPLLSTVAEAIAEVKRGYEVGGVASPSLASSWPAKTRS